MIYVMLYVQIPCKRLSLELSLISENGTGESENELLSCPGFSELNEIINKEISYSLVFGDKVSEMVQVAQVIRKRLKVRDKLMENG